MPHRQLVGRNIVLARNACGQSQEHLAALLNVKRVHLSDWERGIHAPAGGTLERIAAITGHEPDWFFIDRSRPGGELARALAATPLDVAIVTTTEQLELNTWNAAATALFGWTAQEVIGKHTCELWPGGEDARMTRLRRLRDGGWWMGEATVPDREGRPVALEAIAFATIVDGVASFISMFHLA
jgi:PAS domain S-box-containing protein